MKRTSHIITAALLFSTLGAQAGFEGNYRYISYDLGFYSGSDPSVGENKEIGISYSTITTTTDAFTANFVDTMLTRSITNRLTTELETRCINGYSIEMTSESEGGGGSIAPADHLVLNIYPDDNPTELLPLYFSRNTNVALNIEGTSTNGMNEVSMGLLIHEGTGMDNGALDSTYIRYTMGNAAYGSTPSGVGNRDRISIDRAVMNFDGNGQYTESTDAWSVDRITGETNLVVGSDNLVQTYCTLSNEETEYTESDGTYSVLSNGTLLISSDMGTMTNQISPDGNLIASTLAFSTGDYAGTYFTVVVKQPKNRSTNAVEAVYFITEFSEEFSSDSQTDGINNNTVSLGRTYVFLELDGTFSIRSDYWGIENVLTNAWADIGQGLEPNLISANVFSTEGNDKVIEFQSGTYSIATNGVVTLDFGGDDMGQAQLSENGEYLVFAYREANGETAERAMGFGIRRDPPPPPITPIEFETPTMTSTGLLVRVNLPIDYLVEGLFTQNMTEGEWYSAGMMSSESGIIEFVDSELAESGFYNATFAPW